MSKDEMEFMLAAVKHVLGKISEGTVSLVDVPETRRQLDAIQFDDRGNPQLDSVGPLVRAMARADFHHEIQMLSEQRKRESPVRSMLPEGVSVTPEILAGYSSSHEFSSLAFELYKETAGVLAVCSHSYISDRSGDSFALLRNQAICAGLIVRIIKFMTGVIVLVADNSRRGEVVTVLTRSITESATNLRFLTLKNEDRFFDQFVSFSLGPERELYDQIQANIGARGGEELPIERRMLSSIDRVCRLSGVVITDVDPKFREWGGGYRNRLIALGEGERYVALQRGPSHAVHGTWVDLVMRHLEPVNGGFKPDMSWQLVDCRMMLPICVVILAAAHAYVEAFFPKVPDLEPLIERFEDLEDRARRVDAAHEGWLSARADQGTNEAET